jgi:hypothetical protein
MTRILALPIIAEDKLRAAGVLPIGATIKRGSPELLGVPSEKFLYAWGGVTYSDGFGNRRFTDFCHRYNTAVRETPGGGYLIRNTHARHHDHSTHSSNKYSRGMKLFRLEKISWRN